MCDYSLEAQNSRVAAAGAKLVTACFPASTTRGFCAMDNPDLAICLEPGTELVFERPVAFSGLFRFLLQAYQHDCRMARFKHVNSDNHLVHHDALEFESGQIVLLTHLMEGQRATVLQLPVSARRTNGSAAAMSKVLEGVG